MSDPADASEAAASEMAAPIRELHRPVVINDYQDQQADLAKGRNVIEQVRELHERIAAADDANDKWNGGVRDSPTAVITHEMRDALARILADAEGSGQ